MTRFAYACGRLHTASSAGKITRLEINGRSGVRSVFDIRIDKVEGAPLVTLPVEDLLPQRAPLFRVDQILEIETRLLTEAFGMAAVSAVVRVGATVVASGQISLVSR